MRRPVVCRAAALRQLSGRTRHLAAKAETAALDPNLPPDAADSLVHGGVASPQRYSIGLSA
jgi:hypothetical protein